LISILKLAGKKFLGLFFSWIDQNLSKFLLIIILYILSVDLVVRKGGDPANKRNRITPIAKMSAFSPLYSPLSTYGALKPSVPTLVVRTKFL